MALGVHAARGRIAAAVLTTVLVGIAALPAAADTDPAAQVAQAQQQLKAARQQAQQQDSALSAAQQDLASAQAKLAALQQQVDAIDTEIAADDAQATKLDVQQGAYKQQLGNILRASYERGMDSPLLYIASASDLTSALQRQGEMTHIAATAKQLMAKIATARAQVQKAHDDAQARRAQLAVAQQQAATAAVLVTIETQKVQQADAAAWNTVAQSKQHLSTELQAKKHYDDEQAALAAAAAAAAAAQRNQGKVYPPVPGVEFTVDTDLTRPSGETAARLDQFLQGTALQGLGESFMAAEQNYHVSARYLLAHAIEESAWGTSKIAQDKHNLYGYGADDAHPYQDAYTFASFAACIDFVAHRVATDYLSPSGAFYHGPTLRGMNVDYASDPSWAENIASIGRTIP
jgi:beta-N-acetylglucosaminidase